MPLHARNGASCVGARLLTGEFPPRDLGVSGICARFQLQVVTGEADVARHFQGFVFLEALVGAENSNDFRPEYSGTRGLGGLQNQMLFIHGLEKLEQFAHLKSRLVWDSYHIHSTSFQRCRSDVLIIHDSSWFMHAGLYCFIMVDIGSQVFVKRLQVVSTLFIIVYMSIRSRSVFCTKWVL